MLVFTIPIKSRRVSQSWQQTCKLLERTLKSICNQTCADFRVIVICHEQPDIAFSHPHIQIVKVDFPTPDPNDIPSKQLDRIRKEFVGIMAARQFSPCHIMKTDADDCVSRQMAAHVKQNPEANGWFIDKGYVYAEGSSIIYLQRLKFYNWCGSCNIVRDDLYDINQHNIQHLPLEREELLKYYATHFEMGEAMAQQGTPLQPLSFAGAIYSLDNGENTRLNNQQPYENHGLLSYDKPILTLAQIILFNLRPLTQKIRGEFGIYDVNMPPGTGRFWGLDILHSISEMMSLWLKYLSKKLWSK